MNDEMIVTNMIEFIEKMERDIQASKLGSETKARQKAVGTIIKELERELKDADKENRV